MDVKSLILSKEGRLNRKPLWIFMIALSIVEAILTSIGYAIDDSGKLSSMLAFIASLACIMPLIKRCHDRNRSGLFLLLGFIPLVNIWVFIELYFLRGTYGDNKYGKDPLELNK